MMENDIMLDVPMQQVGPCAAPFIYVANAKLPDVTWRKLDIPPMPRRLRFRYWLADRLERLALACRGL